MRKERKQQQFMDNRMKRQNKSNNGKSGDVEMKPPSRESKTIWWNVCKNVIKLDEINKPVQFINPNLAFFDHKNSINKLLEDVKKLESYKRTFVTRKEINETILNNHKGQWSGIAVVQDKDSYHIYYTKKNKYNGRYIININGKLVDYKKFYILFKNKGLVRGKQRIKNACARHEEKKRKEMKKYREKLYSYKIEEMSSDQEMSK